MIEDVDKSASSPCLRSSTALVRQMHRLFDRLQICARQAAKPFKKNKDVLALLITVARPRGEPAIAHRPKLDTRNNLDFGDSLIRAVFDEVSGAI